MECNFVSRETMLLNYFDVFGWSQEGLSRGLRLAASILWDAVLEATEEGSCHVTRRFRLNCYRPEVFHRIRTWLKEPENERTKVSVKLVRAIEMRSENQNNARHKQLWLVMTALREDHPLRSQVNIDVDLLWGAMLNSCFAVNFRYMAMETYLGVLGGAYSALGRTNPAHAKMAGKLARMQLQLARAAQNKISILKCHIYIAESEFRLQKRQMAEKRLQRVRKKADTLKISVVQNICQRLEFEFLSIDYL